MRRRAESEIEFNPARDGCGCFFVMVMAIIGGLGWKLALLLFGL